MKIHTAKPAPRQTAVESPSRLSPSGVARPSGPVAAARPLARADGFETAAPGAAPAGPAPVDPGAVRTPGAGVLTVNTAPTDLQRTYAALQEDLSTRFDFFRPIDSLHVDRGEAQRAVQTLCGLSGAAFQFTTRRLVFENKGEGMENLLRALDKHPDPQLLNTLATAMATRMTDGFTAQAMVARLSPEAWEVLGKARNQMEPSTRASFDQAVGGSPQSGWEDVQQSLKARAAASEVCGDLTSVFRSHHDAAVGAADKLLALQPDALFDRTLRGVATQDGGAHINKLIDQLKRHDPGRLEQLTQRAQHMGPRTRTALMDVLKEPALAAFANAFGAAARPAVDRQLAVLADPHRVGQAVKQLAAETTEVLANAIAPTPADVQWLNKTTQAVKAGDNAAIVLALDQGGPRRFAMLWSQRAALAPFVPPPEAALSHLQTHQGEAWDVRWMFTGDKEPAVIQGLFSNMPAPLASLQPLKPVLAHVRKEFAAPQGNGTPNASLEGGTTFGFTPGADGTGSFTTNVIRMAEVDGKPTPVMTYVEKGTPFAPFQDAFFMLSPDVALAVGRTGARVGGKLVGAPTNPFYMVRSDRETGKAPFES